MKNILITGGSSSIGKKFMKVLDKNEFEIICQIYKNKSLIKKKNTTYIKSNFLNLASLKKFSNLLIKKYEKIHCIVHLPSLKIKIKKFEDYNWLEINNQLNIQVRSLHQIIKDLIKKKKLSHNATIIILGSITTEINKSRGMLDYILAKGLLKQYSNLLKLEFKEKKIYLLNPDMFSSPLLSDLPKYFIKKNAKDSSYKDKIVKKLIAIVNRNLKK